MQLSHLCNILCNLIFFFFYWHWLPAILLCIVTYSIIGILLNSILVAALLLFWSRYFLCIHINCMYKKRERERETAVCVCVRERNCVSRVMYRSEVFFLFASTRSVWLYFGVSTLTSIYHVFGFVFIKWIYPTYLCARLLRMLTWISIGFNLYPCIILLFYTILITKYVECNICALLICSKNKTFLLSAKCPFKRHERVFFKHFDRCNFYLLCEYTLEKTTFITCLKSFYYSAWKLL